MKSIIQKKLGRARARSDFRNNTKQDLSSFKHSEEAEAYAIQYTYLEAQRTICNIRQHKQEINEIKQIHIKLKSDPLIESKRALAAKLDNENIANTITHESPEYTNPVTGHTAEEIIERLEFTRKLRAAGFRDKTEAIRYAIDKKISLREAISVPEVVPIIKSKSDIKEQ